MKPRFCVPLLVVAAISVAYADVPVQAAWEILNRPSFSLAQPNLTHMRPEETEALEVLKRNPVEAERLVVAALSKGGDTRNAMTISTLIIARSEYPRVVRTIVRTYPPLDPSNPFVTFIALSGESGDFGIISARIASAPNSDEAQTLSELMSENPNAYAALLEMKDTVPGKWQESFRMKKIFAMKAGAWPPRSASESGTATKPVTPAPFAPPSAARTPPTLPQSSATTVPKASHRTTEIPAPTHVDRSWWICIGGLAILVIAVAFFARRFR